MTCTCVAFRKSAKNPFLGLLTSYVKLVPDLSRGPGRKIEHASLCLQK